MHNNDLPEKASAVLFQCPYGHFQPRYWWLFGPVGVIGLVGVPLGIFWNEGWEFGNRPVEPWTATVIIEIVAFGALLTFAYIGLSSWYRRKSPQRVAVTDSSLIVPKGAFSNQELTLPFAEINLRVFNVGFVKQLQVKHGRRKILLSSALFPTDADFERFVSHLPR